MTRFTAAQDYKAMHFVDMLMVDNKWMYDLVTRTIGTNKTIFAPSGIDVDFWGGSDYKPDGYILSVSRLADPRKNVRLLLEAYGALRESRSNIPRLVLAGRGGLLPDDWNYAVSRGIADHLDVYADVSTEQLHRLYHNAAMFVLSSNEEGLGIVLLEAMASGLPVISTDCGGPSVVVVPHENGLLTPVGDAQALASAMSFLFDSPEIRRQMGENGFDRVRKHFSFASVGKVYIDVYDQLLGNK
jgi:glycosyltransferase involved in cell wall biosynthesis